MCCAARHCSAAKPGPKKVKKSTSSWLPSHSRHLPLQNTQDADAQSVHGDRPQPADLDLRDMDPQLGGPRRGAGPVLRQQNAGARPGLLSDECRRHGRRAWVFRYTARLHAGVQVSGRSACGCMERIGQGHAWSDHKWITSGSQAKHQKTSTCMRLPAAPKCSYYWFIVAFEFALLVTLGLALSMRVAGKSRPAFGEHRPVTLWVHAVHCCAFKPCTQRDSQLDSPHLCQPTRSRPLCCRGAALHPDGRLLPHGAVRGVLLGRPAAAPRAHDGRRLRRDRHPQPVAHRGDRQVRALSFLAGGSGLWADAGGRGKGGGRYGPLCKLQHAAAITRQPPNTDTATSNPTPMNPVTLTVR